jgi:anti-sigma regulatory factor (Ser/Thr protein kinase)
VVSGVRETSNKLSIPDVDGGIVDASVEGSVSRSLPADLSAVRQAREVVQRALHNWRADDIFDDVVLVASELVANALRHGLQLDQTSTVGRDGVQLSLVSTGRHVICAVSDPSATPPVRQWVDPFAGSGRGLQLVESLSICWGWTLSDDDGKSVWAVFPLDLPRQSQAAGAA